MGANKIRALSRVDSTSTAKEACAVVFRAKVGLTDHEFSDKWEAEEKTSHWQSDTVAIVDNEMYHFGAVLRAQIDTQEDL